MKTCEVIRLAKKCASFSKLGNHFKDSQHKKWLESDMPEFQVPSALIESSKPLGDHEKALYE